MAKQQEEENIEQTQPETPKEERRKKINDLDERSDQVKEILGQAPNWVIQWGISVVFIIVVLFLLGAAYISYNDIIRATVTITSENPPAHIAAKSTGKLTKLFVEAGDKVEAGEVLAVIENTANFEDMQLMKQKLEEFEPNLSDFDSLKYTFPSDLNLGNVQSAYSNFRREYLLYLNYNTQTPERGQVANLRSQIIKAENSLTQRRNEFEIFETTELANAKADFEAQKRLYDKGVITRQAYQRAENTYAGIQRTYESLKSAISGEERSLLALRSNVRQASIGDKTSLLSTDQNLEQAKQDLQNQILQWEQQFVLKSPIKGEVTVFDIWSQYQNVSVGQDLFTIIPDEIEGIIGKVMFPAQNSGKIKVGQDVIIKLDNFPYQEWGSLDGKIINISGVPQANMQGGPPMYIAYLEVPSLTSSYEKSIDFKQEMAGSAEIVVEELTILQRIFYQLREVFSRK